MTPLQERQRILSDAALRLLNDEGPLVVSLPTDWRPGTPVDVEEFFNGLDVPWLHLTSVRQIARGTPAPIDPSQLRYPTARAEEELPSTNFEAAGELLDAGAVTESMLSTNHTLSVETTHQALTVTSYGARARPMVQTDIAIRSRQRLQRLTSQVTVEAPRSVTLSSESGQFSATVTNSLEQRVQVRVVARTDGQLQIEDSPVVDLAPGEVRTVELTARSSKLGLHNVRLAVADADGVPLGASDDFQLRAAQVSNVIWVVFAVGGVLLFGAIAVRLFRRIRDALRRREVCGVSDSSERSESEGILRSSAVMAAGTIVSRMTGFLRAGMLARALGPLLHADIFNLANTIPNMLYILLAGGIFNAVLVPQLVRAMKHDTDGGDAYTNRVLTLAALFLGAVTVLLVLAAPWVMRPFLGGAWDPLPAQRESVIAFARYCLPQVFFYGMFVLVGQILNARGRFGPMMWAPIANNVISVGVLIGVPPGLRNPAATSAAGSPRRRSCCSASAPPPGSSRSCSSCCPTSEPPASATARASTSATPAWVTPCGSGCGPCCSWWSTSWPTPWSRGSPPAGPPRPRWAPARRRPRPPATPSTRPRS